MKFALPLLALALIAASDEPSPARPMPVIVLDPGHGGPNSGAVGPDGMPEKALTLPMAEAVAALLEARGDLRVVLTRSSDVHLALDERPRVANDLNADAFISIHCNSAGYVGPTGFETFYLGEGGATEPLHEEVLRGVAPQEAPDAVRSILGELTGDGARLGGARLAAAIRDELGTHLPGPDRGVKHGMFTVLIGATVPSTVVEVGFLNHPDEGRLLMDPAYQQRIARGIADGTIAYLTRSGRL